MLTDVGAACNTFNRGNRRHGSRDLWSLRLCIALAALVMQSPVRAGELVLPDLLVDTPWLQGKLRHSNLILLDARPAVDYEGGHIEGAVSLPYTDTFAVNGDFKLILSLRGAKELFSKAGIDRRKTVVIYDGGDVSQAARVFWVLEAYGQQRVAILDGGFDNWKSQMLPVSIVPGSPTPSEFIPEPQADRLAGKLATRLALSNPNIALIDSRIEEEFVGKKSRTALAGHIPQAVNVPWTGNLSRSGGISRYKSTEDLRNMYAFVGERKAIAYCNFGNEATLTYFVLRRLGLSPAVYDGSWSEWSLDAQVPKVIAEVATQ